ncbi:hypothetical protein AB0H37_05055 [Actinomadura sp. NPDC023710]|uniref:hypothetical protein n=1 Tax=Actinomadura sp. NPDC023710 TaxID=3158219 RepID=UPI0033CCA32A
MRDLRPQVVLAFRTQHGELGGLERHRPDLDFTLANACHTATAPGPLAAQEIAKLSPEANQGLYGFRLCRSWTDPTLGLSSITIASDTYTSVLPDLVRQSAEAAAVILNARTQPDRTAAPGRVVHLPEASRR